MKTWTREEFNDEVKRHLSEMKQYGYSKADCVKDIKLLMKENDIKISNQK